MRVLPSPLPKPPTDYDGFAEATGNRLRTTDLVSQIELDPGLMMDMFRTVNALLYNSNRTIIDLRAALLDTRQSTAIQSSTLGILLFLAGLFSGWFLHFISAAIWIY